MAGGRRYGEREAELAAEVGASIRRHRERAGYNSPRALGAAMGLDERGAHNFGANLSAIERGRHLPSLAMLLDIAKFLSVTVSDLIGDATHDNTWHAGHRAGIADAYEAIANLRKKEG